MDMINNNKENVSYELDGEVAKKIEEDSYLLVKELLEVAEIKDKGILVVGCSSSEVCGKVIGHDSNYEAAKSIYKGISKACSEKNVFIAAQCCEHLNRAIVVEREALNNPEEVCVVPKPKAGGSWATVCYSNFIDPIVVEEIKGDAGIDIGGTLIGMHLKRVAVPVRLKSDMLLEARITAARTRPKYIGGQRAEYE